jgi:2-polyprenyl-6-methoxyphenol hydroxylase-like FAD-dependent oxidoreductase
MDSQVIIVGAGPVGLTLAVDLGLRGVRCILLEKKLEPQFLPKMERCNARSMEMFRRIGLADELRSAGLTTDSVMDVYVILTMTRAPLLHLKYPSVDMAREQIRKANDGSMPLEPYQLISQYTLEPVLKRAAERIPTVAVQYGTELMEFEEDGPGVVATVRSLDGRSRKITAAYLVGCDGGSSLVRKQLGIRLRGEANLATFRQGLYRCDELYDRLPLGEGPGRGRHYLVADEWATFLIMQDSKRLWTLHAAVESDEEMKQRFEQTIGVRVRYEMLYCGEWRQNLLLTDRYRAGRVFLAGDAVHLVIPAGGLGMNTGVGDAFDLSWKLAATLEGWGGPELLDSYEIERRQVGERNIRASRYATLGYRKWRSQWRPEIGDDTAKGRAVRDKLAKIADVEQRKVNEMIGAELGYRYVDSHIIDNVPGGPEHSFRDYRPTAWPGARLPHVWLEDGTPIQDRISNRGYTLLRLSGRHETAALEKAFRARSAPLSVLHVASEPVRAICERDLILVRPDMHVVWRGDSPPDNPAELAGLATGHGRASP